MRLGRVERDRVELGDEPLVVGLEVGTEVGAQLVGPERPRSADARAARPRRVGSGRRSASASSTAGSIEVAARSPSVGRTARRGRRRRDRPGGRSARSPLRPPVRRSTLLLHLRAPAGRTGSPRPGGTEPGGGRPGDRRGATAASPTPSSDETPALPDGMIDPAWGRHVVVRGPGSSSNDGVHPDDAAHSSARVNCRADAASSRGPATASRYSARAAPSARSQSRHSSAARHGGDPAGRSATRTGRPGSAPRVPPLPRCGVHRRRSGGSRRRRDRPGPPRRRPGRRDAGSTATWRSTTSTAGSPGTAVGPTCATSRAPRTGRPRRPGGRAGRRRRPTADPASTRSGGGASTGRRSAGWPRTARAGGATARRRPACSASGGAAVVERRRPRRRGARRRRPARRSAPGRPPPPCPAPRRAAAPAPRASACTTTTSANAAGEPVSTSSGTSCTTMASPARRRSAPRCGRARAGARSR